MTKVKRKRLYKDTEYAEYLYSGDIGKMSVKELKEYIKKASVEVAKSRNSDYDAVNKSYNFIARKYGERRVRNPETGFMETRLKLGFKDATKEELQERAYQLRGHIRIDAYTNEGKKRWRKISEATLDALEESTGVRLTKKEYNELRNIIADIRDIVEKFGSDNVAKLYEYAKDRTGRGINLVNVLRDVYESRGEAWQKKDFTRAAYDVLDDLLVRGDY